MLMAMLYAACAISQSSDTQDLGRYLGFRLRCLDVDSSARPVTAAAPSAFDVAACFAECPYDGVGRGGSPPQSPLASGPAWRGPAGVDIGGESACGQRQVASSSRSLQRGSAEDGCNIIANSRTADLPPNDWLTIVASTATFYHLTP